MKTIWTLLVLALPIAVTDTVLAQPAPFTYGSALQNADEATTKALGEIELHFEAILETVGTLKTTITMDAERSMIKKAFYGIVQKSLPSTGSVTDIGDEIHDEAELLKRELFLLKKENDKLRSELLEQNSSTLTHALEPKNE